MLQLNRRQHSRIVRSAEILPRHSAPPARHDLGANKSVRLGRPQRRCRKRVRQVHALQPAGSEALVGAGLDRGGEGGGPLRRVGQGVAAGVLLGDVGVPDGVQVGGGAGEGDADLVAAQVVVLVVQRLVDVADEVHEEHERLVDLRGAEGFVLDARGLGDGGGVSEGVGKQGRGWLGV